MNRGIICNFRLEQRLVVVDKHPPCVPVPDTTLSATAHAQTCRCADVHKLLRGGRRIAEDNVARDFRLEAADSFVRADIDGLTALVASPVHLIIQIYGTLLDCENECEQDNVSLEECAPFAVAAAFDGEVTAAIPQSVAVCVVVAHPHHRPCPGGGKRGVPVGGSVPRVDAAQPGQPESSDRPITDQWQSIITDLFFNVVQNGSNQPVEA